MGSVFMWHYEIFNGSSDSTKAMVLSNISRILSDVILLSATPIYTSSSPIIPEVFEPPPIFLASRKLASTFDLAANFT